MDYILLSLIIFYFLFTTMSGVRHLGVRFCGLKVHVLHMHTMQRLGAHVMPALRVYMLRVPCV